MNVSLYCFASFSRFALELENPIQVKSLAGKTMQDYDHGSDFSIKVDYQL